jgi:predicted outer membrane protein
LSGDQFDREYAKVLAKNSRDSQARYIAEARAAPNSANYELRKFAVRQLAEVLKRKPAIDAIANRYGGK